MAVTREDGRWEEGEEAKEGNTHGDRRRLDFKWWTLNRVLRCCVTKIYPWNVHNIIKQCYPHKFN